jgi:integrase
VIRKHIPTLVYAMIRLQVRTGMRPGEVTKLRTCDIDSVYKVTS